MSKTDRYYQSAQGIVARAKLRGNVLPRQLYYQIVKKNQNNPELIQEHKDAMQICNWVVALQGKKGRCPDEIRDYLDVELPSWRDRMKKEFKPYKPRFKKLAQPKETPDQKYLRIKSELSSFQQRFATFTSNKEFQENKDLWMKYHELSEEYEKSFPPGEIPRNRIIQELDKIKIKRTKKVVDMGCGKADIAKHFATDSRFTFTNYDHVSSNESVVSCDISHTPLEDDSAEICILSMAMWGSDCREYITESARVLESNGMLYIIESTKRWSEKDADGNNVKGEKMKLLLEKNGFRIVEESVGKYCLFVCIKLF